MSKNATLDGYATRQEVATHFRISLRTVDKLIASKRIPHLHIGRRRIFNIPQLEKFFENTAEVKARIQ